MFVHQQYSNFKKDMSPKKYIKKHPVVAVVCFTGLIWAMGLLLLDAPAPYIWEKHFAKIDELENRFAPVAAFFFRSFGHSDGLSDWSADDPK